MSRLFTEILSLSARDLGCLAALVYHTDDNSSGDTYEPGDCFGHLSNVARTIRETVPLRLFSLDQNPTDTFGLWKMLTPSLEFRIRSSFLAHMDEPGWDTDGNDNPTGDFRYAVTAEVYALKDAIIAAAKARLAQEVTS